MRRFALIGFPLGHSFSARYFTQKFTEEDIRDAVYELVEMKDVEGFLGWIKETQDLRGLNVTIPLKSIIIPLLNKMDPVARKIGAVNCIRIDRSSAIPETIGFNTDYAAFRDTLKPLLKPHHTKAMVLGTGGSARAVCFALGELGIDFQAVSRTPKENEIGYDALTKSLLTDHPVLINTSPVGMFPNDEGLPDLPYRFLTSRHLLYDLVYNPATTRFLKEGKKMGATIKSGLEMLYLQADYAWKIWNDETD
jgi:shikimate dehydrogenase